MKKILLKFAPFILLTIVFLVVRNKYVDERYLLPQPHEKEINNAILLLGDSKNCVDFNDSILDKYSNKNIYNLSFWGASPANIKKMVENIKYIHSKDIIHRDIKPENFLFSKGDSNVFLYIIDFGFAKMYIKNGKHVSILYNKGMIGSPNFVSVNIHNGIEASRRDDLESVGYILLWMYQRGKLEWTNKKNEEIKEMKINCLNKINMSTQISDFIKYCRKLEYNETPNYDYLLYLLEKTSL
jgi:serine/threonine protein kinase